LLWSIYAEKYEQDIYKKLAKEAAKNKKDDWVPKSIYVDYPDNKVLSEDFKKAHKN
jgi:hypothetical protein